MKKPVLTLLLSVAIFVTTAQTKVFKEVSEDIATQTRGIIQDNSLVGYVISSSNLSAGTCSSRFCNS